MPHRGIETDTNNLFFHRQGIGTLKFAAPTMAFGGRSAKLVWQRTQFGIKFNGTTVRRRFPWTTCVVWPVSASCKAFVSNASWETFFGFNGGLVPASRP